MQLRLLIGFGLLWAQDTLQPPFFIHPSKRLAPEELQDKKEGYVFTGLPEVKRNPINGLGLGASFYIYNNKTRRDPFLPTRLIEPTMEVASSSFKIVNGKATSVWTFPICLASAGACGST